MRISCCLRGLFGLSLGLIVLKANPKIMRLFECLINQVFEGVGMSSSPVSIYRSHLSGCCQVGVRIMLDMFCSSFYLSLMKLIFHSDQDSKLWSPSSLDRISTAPYHRLNHLILKSIYSSDPNLIVWRAFGKIFKKSTHQLKQELKEFVRKRCDQRIYACLNKNNF